MMRAVSTMKPGKKGMAPGKKGMAPGKKR